MGGGGLEPCHRDNQFRIQKQGQKNSDTIQYHVVKIHMFSSSSSSSSSRTCIMYITFGFYKVI